MVKAIVKKIHTNAAAKHKTSGLPSQKNMQVKIFLCTLRADARRGVVHSAVVCCAVMRCQCALNCSDEIKWKMQR